VARRRAADGGRAQRIASSRSPTNTDTGSPGAARSALSQPGSATVPKQSFENVERLVQELMDRQLTKAERMQRLRELVQSGKDVPDELLDQALRKLMERLTD
jgi:hypothetical protein